MAPKIILASTSKYRANLLRRWQIEFMAQNPELDESPFKKLGLNPFDLALRLSLEKASCVQKLYPDALVIGSDQVLSCDSKIYGKAGSKDTALKQLLELSGKSQKLITGLCVLYKDQVFEHLDITEITLKKFSPRQASAVLEKDQSWDCAGSLKIESAGTLLIESLRTEDPSAIEGLPLLALSKILMQLPDFEPVLFGG